MRQVSSMLNILFTVSQEQCKWRIAVRQFGYNQVKQNLIKMIKTSTYVCLFNKKSSGRCGWFGNSLMSSWTQMLSILSESQPLYTINVCPRGHKMAGEWWGKKGFLMMFLSLIREDPQRHPVMLHWIELGSYIHS